MGSNLFEVEEKNWDAEVLKSSTPVIVDFWAEWCAPCKMLDPIIDEIAAEYQGKVRVVKIDADANTEVVTRYGVMGMPTLILFKNGQEVERIHGFKAKQKILSTFGEHI